MNKKMLISVIVIIVVIIAIVMFNKTKSTSETANTTNNIQNNNVAKVALIPSEDKKVVVKEFVMTSFYDNTGVWFSLKEMSVNKGDLVRIKVTNIKGSHNFNIDEYGIKKMTPLNEEVVIEFTSDKVGEFIYYCSVPGHRQKGQWGTLKVLNN